MRRWCRKCTGWNIGEGLLGFLLLAAIAGLWAAWDASRRHWLVTALVWVATGQLTSVGMAALALSSQTDLRDIVSHLGGTDAFRAGLVIVPVLLCTALVAFVRLALRPPARPTSV